MKFDFDRVLVLSPHTDDAELGAGGTVARLVEEGKIIHFVIFSRCEESVPEGLPRDILQNECMNSMAVLGVNSANAILLDYKVRHFPEYRQEILEDLIKFRKALKPDLVLIPSSRDMHQDHATIYWEALRAFKKEASIWGYEHPWNNLTFTTDVFVRLEQRHIDMKIRALGQYKSQQNRSYMDERNILALAYTRGAQLDTTLAEAFELVRIIY